MKHKKKSKKSQEEKLGVASSSGVKKEKSSGEECRVVKKRQLYDREQLLAAFNAVKETSMAVSAASKLYGVPLTTLRDRVDGRISMDETIRPGPPQLLAKEEEAEIANFLHTMARYGYRYTRHEIGEIATDQAVEKGKKNPRANGLTVKWVENFMGRWPSIKELSCKFENKCDAEHTVRTYFDEIKKIIDRYKLLNKSDRIFNIVEIGLDTNHGVGASSPSKRGHQFKTENVSHTTILSCASVSGTVMAPFFVFQSQKLRQEMLRGVPSDVNATVSETGCCTPRIFRRYLNEHFLPQTQRTQDSDPILVLMDGSRSHIFVSLAEWGRVNNVIFSFVPAHTTHLLQPLEVECIEKIQRKYQNICLRVMKSFSGPRVTRNSVAEMACRAYYKVLNGKSVVHAYKKAGVYPDLSSDESDENEESTTDEACVVSLEADEKEEEEMYDIKEETPIKEESVFTGDPEVGHSEEVTEEEIITQEIFMVEVDSAEEKEDESSQNSLMVDAKATTEATTELAEEQHQEKGRTDVPCQPKSEKELVITPDGQLMMKNGKEMTVAPGGHVVIHNGSIYVNSMQGGVSHLKPLQLIDEAGADSQGTNKSSKTVHNEMKTNTVALI